MGPTSRLVFAAVLLLAVVLLVLVARLRRATLKIIAGVLVVVASMTCGVLAVNDYYGYYTTWGSAVADLSGASNSYAVTQIAATSRQVGQPSGRLLAVTLPGRTSDITRQGLVYLPAQYFQPAYRDVRFPVIELLHGTPGNPAQWVDAARAPLIAQRLIDSHRMGPVVLVMPDSNGSLTGAQECLNTAKFQDDTYVSQDVPADIRGRFRVSADPGQWGLVGASSGGYCAANLLMRHRSAFGAVASIDGYYRPQDGTAGALIGANRALTLSNDPLAAALANRPGRGPLAPFWVAAGTGERSDYRYAQGMVAAMRRLEQVPFLVMRGARHNFAAVRAALPSAFTWSWEQLCSPDQRRLFPTFGTKPGATVYTTPLRSGLVTARGRHGAPVLAVNHGATSRRRRGTPSRADASPT